MSLPVLLAVVCSTRPGRVGRLVGDWFVETAREIGSFDVRLVDLAELGLPLMDEPKHPRFHDYTHEHTLRWSRTVAGADALVWVQPEYNYSMCASQKNAIDYLALEWARLPTGFVSYGAISGGLRGVEHAKQPLASLSVAFAQPAVAVPQVATYVSDGTFSPPKVVVDSVAPMMAELATLHGALADVRRAKLEPLGY